MSRVIENQDEQVQTAIRLSRSFLAELDKLAEIMSEPGKRFTRAEVLRIAAFRGAALIKSERMKKR